MIDDAEAQKRRAILLRAQRMVESEGLKIPEHVLAMGERFVAGEVTIEQALHGQQHTDQQKGELWPASGAKFGKDRRPL